MKTKLNLKKETVEILNRLGDIEGGNATQLSVNIACIPALTNDLTCNCPSRSCPIATVGAMNTCFDTCAQDCHIFPVRTVVNCHVALYTVVEC